MPLLRSDVNDNRKWDLNKYFKTESEYYALFEDVKGLIPALANYEKNMDSTNAHEVLDLASTISRGLEKLYVYAHSKHDEDTANAKYQGMLNEIRMLSVSVQSASSFITPTLAAFSNIILKDLASKPEYKKYTSIIRDIIREKRFVLSAKEEKIMSQISSFSGEFSNIFTMLDNADLKVGTIKDENGEDVELSHGTYALMLQNPDRNVRREAFKTYYKAYKGMHNTISATYIANVKKDCALTKIRGYKSTLHAALYGEGIDKSVYTNLIKAVEIALPLVHKYVWFRRRALKIKPINMYDLYVPITKEAKLEMEYDDAYALVLKALEPLGKDYIDLLKKAKEERWIDVDETKNKRSGAYSTGCYDANPLVLLNYQKTTHDVFTIAHEMGHALHTYLSNTNQCFEKADYTIFLAEIASTVNEMLLIKYLLNNNPSEEMEKFLLSYLLDTFRTTLFRQTMFSEFESFAHEEIENDRPLTGEILNAKYYELNKKYYGKKVIHDEEIAYEWSRIPHFYRSFYVYKYATGLTAAVNIVDKILNEKDYTKKYLKFLSLGNSKLPLDALMTADVDLTMAHPFKVAMAEFKSALLRLGKYVK